MKLQLGTKAETLHRLYGQLQEAEVLAAVSFSLADYRTNPKAQIQKGLSLQAESLIVRSSSFSEDNLTTSNAGGFDSVANVAMDDKSIESAIATVIDSYGDNADPVNQVLIQPMLEGVVCSGVVVTADMDTLAPYYIVNYDDSSGSTDTVTAGSSADLKTYIAFKGAPVDPEDERMRRVIGAAAECERLFGNSWLDIEFAFDDQNRLYLFQVRPIVQYGKDNLSEIDLADSLRKLGKKISKLNQAHPNLLGDRTIFGVMPDWNPAEIIGVKPKRLALSLYKELVTDEIWASQRSAYGYRDLAYHPLLVSFLGVPYIDIRVSFNSFIPADLDDGIAAKLVNHYLNQLESLPNHHDKVEFKILHSCYYFDLDRNLEPLKQQGFGESEISALKHALLVLTRGVIDPDKGLYRKDLDKIDKLVDRFDAITQSDLHIIDKIYWLIKDCKLYGTLPFAGIARAGFIAVQLLNSLVDLGVLSGSDKDTFMNSLNTVSKQYSRDLLRLQQGALEKNTFIQRYGHLRPGTYDILSPRYQDDLERYMQGAAASSPEEVVFGLTRDQEKKIDQLLAEQQLAVSVSQLFEFVRGAIEGREYAKFVFTRMLSEAIELLSQFGRKFDFDDEQIAFLDLQKVLNLYSTLDHRDVADILRQDIHKNQQFYKYTRAIKLPSLIVDERDLYGYHLQEEEPNFVTLGRVKGACIREKDLDQELKGKIVFIRSADPGYDFLFAKGIAGLVTQYGGANSHMAIRCAELKIPAVIGAGEKYFSHWSDASQLEIDCANRKVTVLS